MTQNIQTYNQVLKGQIRWFFLIAWELFFRITWVVQYTYNQMKTWNSIPKSPSQSAFLHSTSCCCCCCCLPAQMSQMRSWFLPDGPPLCPGRRQQRQLPGLLGSPGTHSNILHATKSLPLLTLWFLWL